MIVDFQLIIDSCIEPRRRKGRKGFLSLFQIGTPVKSATIPADKSASLWRQKHIKAEGLKLKAEVAQICRPQRNMLRISPRYELPYGASAAGADFHRHFNPSNCNLTILGPPYL